MNPEDYYIITLVGPAGGGTVQWSIPCGVRAVIKPDITNTNIVSVSDGSGGFWSLNDITAASGVQDRIVLPNGYPKPLFFAISAGDSLDIWCMPCGGDY
jgi:hypothetical protein